MKELKCPLCGNKITPHYLTGEQLCGESVGGAYYFSCSHCRWSIETKRGTEELALREVEKFISKFPPIMRLNQGDNVLVWLSDDIHTVLGVNLEAGKIHLQDVYGDADSYNPTDIEKWPWELKQKGGK